MDYFVTVASSRQHCFTISPVRTSAPTSQGWTENQFSRIALHHFLLHGAIALRNTPLSAALVGLARCMPRCRYGEYIWELAGRNVIPPYRSAFSLYHYDSCSKFFHILLQQSSNWQAMEVSVRCSLIHALREVHEAISCTTPRLLIALRYSVHTMLTQMN